MYNPEREHQDYLLVLLDNIVHNTSVQDSFVYRGILANKGSGYSKDQIIEDYRKIWLKEIEKTKKIPVIISEPTLRIFEIHITGDYNILRELNQMGLKAISVGLLKPNGVILRTEFMSSILYRTIDFETALDYTNSIVSKLKCNVYRVKIECPYYEDYVNKSLYIESHFEPKGWELHVPKSINLSSGKIMGTSRTYDITEYDLHRETWAGEEIELCLHDTFIYEDKDWFDLYENI